MVYVLVLDRSLKPINVVPLHKAVHMCVKGRAEVVLSWDNGKAYRSEHLSLSPKVIITNRAYVEVPRVVRKHVTNHVLFARDNYTCQYCGKAEGELRKLGLKLTRDHIKPVSRFEGATKGERKAKADTWENCVTACSKCNNIKDNRLPWEASMRLISAQAPKEPTGVIIPVRFRNLTDAEQLAFVNGDWDALMPKLQAVMA